MVMRTGPGRRQNAKELMPSDCGAGEDSWESLDSREIKPVNFKGHQPWIVTGRTDAEAEAPVFWSSNVNRWLNGKVPDAGKDWGQKEKRGSEDEMAGQCYYRCIEQELGQTLGAGKGQGGCHAEPIRSQRVRHNSVTEQQQCTN